MKRTRKWTFVAQEATRLSGLGLSPREIADRLELSKSTVTRWIAAGKLPKPDPSARRQAIETPGCQSPDQWALTVRKGYALDATDDQLVNLAEDALLAARDRTLAIRERLGAMGRFQALVKQLALVPREVEEPAPAPVPEEPAQTIREPRQDPRAHLMAEMPTVQ